MANKLTSSRGYAFTSVRKEDGTGRRTSVGTACISGPGSIWVRVGPSAEMSHKRHLFYWGARWYGDWVFGHNVSS